MKMINTLYPSSEPYTELFDDGEIYVVNNIIEFDKAHWKDPLYLRGYEDYEEPTPSRRGKGKNSDEQHTESPS